MLRTASFRLAAMYMLVFVISALVLGAAVYFGARSALQHQMTARIETETAFLRKEFNARGLDHLVSLAQLRGRGATSLEYLVQDATGARLAGEMPAGLPSAQGWVNLDVPEATEDDGRAEKVQALVTDLGAGLTLAVGDDLGRIGEVEESVAAAFLSTLSLVVLLGISGGVLLSRAFLTRVEAIARTAEAIIGGDLTRRVPLRGTGDDLDRLAATLNRMLDRIETLMDSLRQVSSDVAHDLRTPLTRLYQRLEATRTHADTIEHYQCAVEGAIDEAEGLLETFSALLRIAQVEGAAPRTSFREVDLSATVERVADAYRPDIEEAAHSLSVHVAHGLLVLGDQELLTQAIANLIENALRHTPPDTTIRISLSATADGHVLLAIEDDGPGVSPDDLGHLTERFYRGDISRTTPGNGLGLTLVAAVIELHDARLYIMAGAPNGLAVSACFEGHCSANH